MNNLLDKLLQHDFTKWFMICVMKKYADFNGRAQRQEYWMFTLVAVIINVLLSIIGGILGTAVIGMIFGLAVLVPSVAAGVRRLHDTGRSGWWMLIALVPLIGGLALLYFFILDSTPGENKYGPNPKGL